jgi:CopA family copper-resistance protein
MTRKVGFVDTRDARVTRRRFVQGLAAGGVMSLSSWTRTSWALLSDGEPQVLVGRDFELTIGETPMNFTGRTRTAITVNGTIPAPILRWREGDTVTLSVSNALPEGSIHGHDTSIHWHGILLPANMDGVPGLSFNGIGRGETYRYHFDVKQGGTYWYHSHSAFQEQAGLYGALIIDPRDPEPFSYERDYVVLLSDWTDLDARALFARLKKMSEHDNFYKRTFGDFVRDARQNGLERTIEDRRMWGSMRMTPTDLSDVNAHTYTYLINGQTSVDPWTALFLAGERVRLRFINGSSMTYFDVRIPGLKMTIVAADGQYVHPVSVDEFRIATAETYDVIVEPSGQDAFAIFAQDMGRTGFAAGMLAVRQGLRAPLPPVDPRPILTMEDMGHGGHAGHGMISAPPPTSADGPEPDTSQTTTAQHADHAHQQTPLAATYEHSSHGAAPPAVASEIQAHPESETGNPLVDMQTVTPAPRLDDPGIGLRNNARCVLTYSDLRSLFADPDGREPSRTIELHLTGHMERFAWSFNGIKFSDAAPLRLTYGERLRVTLVNDTMMTHPIHLHGMWSDVEDSAGHFQVRKHTVDMPPGTRRSYRVRADALGRWAYHCHLLYHMESGMMREVRVEE